MDQAKVNGVELEYEEKGSGEPVILIGTGPIADSFLPFFFEKALDERYHLIRYHTSGDSSAARPALGWSASPSMRSTRRRSSDNWASVVPM
jgi:hypothetical protein